MCGCPVQGPGRPEWGHVPIVLRPATKLSSHLSHHFYTITPSLCSATVEWKRKIVRLQDDNLEHEQFSFHLRIRVRLVLLNVGMWVFEVKYWLTAFRRCLPPAQPPRRVLLTKMVPINIWFHISNVWRTKTRKEQDLILITNVNPKKFSFSPLFAESNSNITEENSRIF